MGLRRVRCAPDLIASALTEGNEIHLRFHQGLPPGAILVAVEQYHRGGFNPITGLEDLDVAMVFDHQSWDATEDGSIPDFNPAAQHGSCTRYVRPA